MLAAIIHGFMLAFPLIMPLGAQNVFVFNYGASQKRFVRILPVVITAGVCDTILISLAVLGVSVVVLGNVFFKTVLLGIGTAFLVYMGWLTWTSTPTQVLSENEREETKDGSKTIASGPQTIVKAIVFTVSVSLFNPHAIIDTIGVIGTNSLKYMGPEKTAFAASTILVSWIWFFGLAITGRLVRSLDQSGRLVTLINKISALLMWGAATYLVLSIM